MKILSRSFVNCRNSWAVGFCVLTLCLTPAVSHAGSPWLVDPAGTGTPFTWGGGYIPWYVEYGKLGPLTPAQILDEIQKAFARWQNAFLIVPGLLTVPVVALTPTMVGTIKVDIDESNVTTFYESSVAIVLDPEAKILAKQEGLDIQSVAAATYLNDETADPAGLTLRTGITILNGKFLEGADPTNPDDVKMHTFRAALLHEIGHLLNLDHSAVGQAIENDVASDPNLAAAIPTMHPRIITADQWKSLHDDDVVALATLYPKPEFTSQFCTIAGQLLGSDGKGFQGALVIARSKLDPLVEAIGAVTGNQFPEGTADGSYFLRGIRPGRKYLVEYGAIGPSFVGGSSIQPYGDDEGETPRSGFGNGSITAGGGKLFEVSCEKVGQVIAMDTVPLSVEAGGTPPKNSALPPPPAPSAGDEPKSGGCTLLPR